MKKLIIIVLLASLSIVASAGFSYTLTANGNTYNPGDNVGLIAGDNVFSLDVYSSVPMYVGTFLSLMLQPNTAAYYNFPAYPTLIPFPWSIYYGEDYEILMIDLSDPSPLPPPVSYYQVDFPVHFNGPAADFSVLDSITGEITDTFHLVPEPASLLLLGLGGLALRMRKK